MNNNSRLNLGVVIIFLIVLGTMMVSSTSQPYLYFQNSTEVKGCKIHVDYSNLTCEGDIQASQFFRGGSILNNSAEIVEQWISPEHILDVDKSNIEGDVNTFVDIPGDVMSGDLQTVNLNVTGNFSVDGELANFTNNVIAGGNVSSQGILFQDDTYQKSAANPTTISPTAPSNPEDGDLWFNPASTVLIDTLQTDTGSGRYHSLVNINDTLFILANDIDNKGNITTFITNSTSGEITLLESIEHIGDTSIYNSLIKINDTRFFLAFTGNNLGVVKTFSTDSSGMNIAEIDSLTHHSPIAKYNSAVKINFTYFIVAYHDNTDGLIASFIMNATHGDITEISSHKYGGVLSGTGTGASLVNINDTALILADCRSTTEGYITTFITNSSLGIKHIHRLQHESTTCFDNSLVKINNTHFLLAYGGAGDDGFAKIFSVNATLGITEVTSFEHDTNQGKYNSLVKVDNTSYFLSYRGEDNDGFVSALSLDTSYTSIAKNDEFEYDTTQILEGSLVIVDSTHFLISYGQATSPFLKSFTRDTPEMNIFHGSDWLTWAVS